MFENTCRIGGTAVIGYTPVRGTDYWTESDRQQIVKDEAVKALFDRYGMTYSE